MMKTKPAAETRGAEKPRRIRKVFKRMGRFAKRAGVAFSGALLAGSLMLGSGKAHAQEPVEKPKVGLGVKMGAAFDHTQNEPRALAVLSSSVPLPKGLRLMGTLGVSSSFDGSAGMEEVGINLSIPIAGPVSVDLYGYNSRHLAVQKFSAGGDIFVALPFGAVIVAFENIFDAGQRPLVVALKVDAVPDVLTFFVHGAWITNMDAGALRARMYINSREGMPTFGIDSFVIFNADNVLFCDTMVSLEFKY